MSEVPDRVLWRQAYDGDGEAFGILFERHGGRIYNYCFRRTADWALAEDLTSATFLLAWRGLRREPCRRRARYRSSTGSRRMPCATGAAR
jgi:DNA-directed RNA polymerase specialized sigma24 family protein